MRFWMATWRRWKADERGVAFLEFALALPLLMLLFLGGVEYSRYVQTSQKVDKLTHTVVDLVAQAPTISTKDLDTIFEATKHIMEPNDFSKEGVVIVSCVGFDTNNNLVVKWQYKGGGSLVRDSAIGKKGDHPVLPAGFTVDARDNVIISESFFSFHSMINDNLVPPIEFYSNAYYLPRLGELGTLIQN